MLSLSALYKVRRQLAALLGWAAVDLHNRLVQKDELDIII